MSESKSLRNVLIFKELTAEELDSVQQALKERSLTAGQVLFNQGDPGNELIIVQQGQIAIYAPTPGQPGAGQAIRIFQPGELLGEMALIDRKPRSLSARAETDSVILALSDADFHRLIQENPEMGLSVMAGLSDRIRYTTDFLTEVRQWVGKIAEGNYQDPGIQEASQRYQDSTLASLAADFARMTSRVQKREERLKSEVALLRIEIDETKRKQDVQEIMGSDYYRQLREKIKLMRETGQEEE